MGIKVKSGSSAKQQTIYKRDANAIISILKNDLSYPDNAVAAIMGNIAVETGYTYNYLEKQSSGGPGLGLFQMETTMQKRYGRWLSSSGKKNSLESQVLYMDAELNDNLDEEGIGRGNSKKIRESFKKGTTDQINKLFWKRFERTGTSNASERLKAGNDFNKVLKNISPIKEIKIEETDLEITSESNDETRQFDIKVYDLNDNFDNQINKLDPDYDERLDRAGMDEINPEYRVEGRSQRPEDLENLIIMDKEFPQTD